MQGKYTDLSFKRRPFVYLLIPLILGILTVHFFEGLYKLFLPILITLFATSLAIVILRWADKQKNLRVLTTSLLFFCIFLFGILFSLQENVTQKTNWVGNQISTATAFRGQVTESPETKPKTTKLTISVEQARIEDHWEKSQGKIILYLYKSDSSKELFKGAEIIFPNDLVPIQNRRNPFEFDYASFLQRKGMYYQAFLSPEAVYLSQSSPTKNNFIDQLRGHLMQSIERNIKDTATAGLTEATLLNDRDLLNNDIRKAYSATGIAHIIAISGLHVSLFFGILLVLLSWIRSARFRWIKYLIGLPVIWTYITLTGFPPSAVRAATMFSFVFLALALRKQIQSLNFLAATGFILLAIHPSWLFDTGVQLSFSAVASILLFFRPINEYWKPNNKILKFLWASVSVSLSAQILVFPLILYYFHQFPLWFLLANIPASLYSVALMSSALLLFVLDAIGLPCVWLGDLMGLMTNSFHTIIFFFSEHTPSALLHLSITQPQFWILMLLTIFFSIAAFSKKGWILLSGLTCLCLFLVTFILNDLQTRRQERIVVYNYSNYSLIDIFRGNKGFLISQNDPEQLFAAIDYTLLPSRLGYHIQKPTEIASGKYLQTVKGKKILFLNEKIRAGGEMEQLPVEFLIVSKEVDFKPELWQRLFHPQKIILDSSLPRWKAEKWAKELGKLGINVHNINQDGAWVYPED